jgi:hypothetical protein
MTTAPKRSSARPAGGRFPWIVVILPVLLVIAGGAFFLFAGGGPARFDEWAERLRADGYTVTIAEATEDDARATLEGVEIGRGGGALPWRWSAATVVVESFENGRTDITVPGPQTLTWSTGDAEHTATLNAEAFRVVVPPLKDGGRLEGVTIEIAGLSAVPGTAEAPAGSPTTAEAIRLDVALAEGPGIVPDGSTAIVDVEDLEAPALADTVFGKDVGLFKGELTLTGALSSLDLGEALQAWQAQNGALGASRLELGWGLLSFSGAGTLGLDRQFVPTGELQGRVRAFLKLLDVVNVSYPLEAGLRADYYATMVERLAAGETDDIDVVIALGDGKAAIRAADLPLAAFVAGTLSPLVTLPARAAAAN